MSRALLAFVFLYLAATVAFAVLVFFYTRNIHDLPAAMTETRDQRPDIQHCFADDVDLWDCIRYKETDK